MLSRLTVISRSSCIGELGEVPFETLVDARLVARNEQDSTAGRVEGEGEAPFSIRRGETHLLQCSHTWRAGVRWQVARTESAGGSEQGLALNGSVRW